MSIPRPHYRFTIEKYERMHEIGIIEDADRVELICGEVVEMSPIGGRHIASVTVGTTFLARNCGLEVLVSSQVPVRIPDDSMPRADIVAFRADYDQTYQPTPVDVLLVIEVADSSLEYDSTTKLPLYAAAGIPESWLFNLIANRIERHTDPTPTGYRRVAFGELGKRLSSTVLSGVTFDAAEMLGL